MLGIFLVVVLVVSVIALVLFTLLFFIDLMGSRLQR